jgi:type IV pilus assembly protein PilE
MKLVFANRRRTRGFTLIEVMIVVAIVAILAAIAVPSYRYAVMKGKRAQGRTAILDLIQQEERYMTQNNKYLEFTSSSSVFKTFSGDNPASSAYNMTAALCPNPAGGSTPLSVNECIQVIATPVAGEASDPAAGILRMTSTGVKDCSVTPAPNANTTCWP